MMKRRLNILFLILFGLMLAAYFFGPNAHSITPGLPLFAVLFLLLPSLRKTASASVEFTDFVLEKRFGKHMEAVRWAGFGVLTAGFFFQALCPDLRLGTNVFLISLAVFFVHSLWLFLVIADQKAIWREKWEREHSDP